MSCSVAYRHKRKKPMVLTQGVKVDLPQAAAETVAPASIPPLVVTVDAEGNLHLTKGAERSLQLDAEGLAVRIAAELRLQPDTPVYVRGDRNVPYGKVVTVMAVLQQSGVAGVGLLTETPE